MSLSFRQLYQNDFALYEQMDTQLEDDYMLRVFNRITSEGNALFGLFENDILVAVAGYTLFAGEFAMMGRLRSDSRYRQNGYGTLITEYIYNEAKRTDGIKWIGANTEKRNTPAQKVLKKLDVPHITTLYAAQADDLSSLITQKDATNWQRVESVDKKRKWLEETYLNPDFDKSVFPFEAYYPFPARPALFTDDRLGEWLCFENKEANRVVFMWEEEKGRKYLHVVYPWSDFMEQPGLFSLISSEFKKSQDRYQTDAIWMDLTEEEAKLLPDNHSFDLPSPWMLHGHFVSEQEQAEFLSNQHLQERNNVENERSVNDSINKADELLSDLEAELTALEENVLSQQSEIDDLQDRLDLLDSDS